MNEYTVFTCWRGHNSLRMFVVIAATSRAFRAFTVSFSAGRARAMPTILWRTGFPACAPTWHEGGRGPAIMVTNIFGYFHRDQLLSDREHGRLIWPRRLLVGGGQFTWDLSTLILILIGRKRLMLRKSFRGNGINHGVRGFFKIQEQWILISILDMINSYFILDYVLHRLNFL